MNLSKIEPLVETERQRSPTLVVVIFHVNEHKLAKIPDVEQLLSFGAVAFMGYREQLLTNWSTYHLEIRRFMEHDEGTPIIAFIHIGSVATPPHERPGPDYDNIVSEWRPST